MGKLGNKFGLVFLSLPISTADPLQRLSEVHSRMEELKSSSEAGVILAALNVVGLSTSQIQDLVVAILAKKATAVLTNVPGPPIPLFLAGREIEDLMFWVPQAGRLGLGISILSYAGKVYMGVATDVKLIPDPDRVVDHFYTELDLLLESVQPAAAEASVKVDDLTQIEGVSPNTAELLNGQGIVNFDQLGISDVSRLRKILDDAGPPHNNTDPANWPAQARYLSKVS
jgi:hypothetical protein